MIEPHRDWYAQDVIDAARIVCPMCDTEGWSSSILAGAYHAACGTTWGDDVAPRLAPACDVIARLRVEVAVLRMGVAA